MIPQLFPEGEGPDAPSSKSKITRKATDGWFSDKFHLWNKVIECSTPAWGERYCIQEIEHANMAAPW
jgi:hypothetical protein